jgi:hypothetical protein
LTGEKTVVNRPKLGFDPRRRRFDGLGVGHVCRDHQRPASQPLDRTRGVVEPLAPPRDQADACAAPSERLRDGPAQASAGSRDDHNLPATLAHRL